MSARVWSAAVRRSLAGGAWIGALFLVAALVPAACWMVYGVVVGVLVGFLVDRLRRSCPFWLAALGSLVAWLLCMLATVAAGGVMFWVILKILRP